MNTIQFEQLHLFQFRQMKKYTRFMDELKISHFVIFAFFFSMTEILAGLLTN